MLWERGDLERDPLYDRLAAATRRGRRVTHNHRRPLCGAFKSIIMLRAMERSRDGDYVMWADSSKHHPHEIVGSGVHEAIERLRGLRRRATARWQLDAKSPWRKSEWYRAHDHGRGWDSHAIGSVYGILHCYTSCVHKRERFARNRDAVMVHRDTAVGFADFIRGGRPAIATRSAGSEAADLVPSEALTGDYELDKFLVRQPHVLNTHMLLENSPANRDLVHTWYSMAVREPNAFCNSSTQDQAAWSILVYNRSLPLVNPCVYRNASKLCFVATKNVNDFLGTIRSGRWETVAADERALL
eukprot:1056721-Prymnesium_polylepis.1